MSTGPAASSALVDQVREVAADVFGVEAASLSASSSPESVEAWDSVMHLNLVLALEQRFNIALPPEAIEKIKTLGAAAEVVASLGGK
jgi:acyl carrier protein